MSSRRFILTTVDEPGGTPIDPTLISFGVRATTGNEDYVYGPTSDGIVRDALGLYHFDLVIDPAWSGAYLAEWTATIADEPRVGFESFTPDDVGQPTINLAALRVWLGAGLTAVSDEILQDTLDAELVLQARVCRVPADSYPSPLRQAVYRRVGRELAARGVPLGLAGLESEGGSARLPSFDPEIERLEGTYRKMVFA